MNLLLHRHCLIKVQVLYLKIVRGFVEAGGIKKQAGSPSAVTESTSNNMGKPAYEMTEEEMLALAIKNSTNEVTETQPITDTSNFIFLIILAGIPAEIPPEPSPDADKTRIQFRLPSSNFDILMLQ